MPPSHKRLLKEATELSTSPSPHFHAAPVQDNLYDWHFTLAGPPSPSPYSGGIYHGRIVLPPTYPLRPPSFRFLTPTGRFEVNREICLSISGHHEESWQPAWGIRTALIAIRSFMDGDAKGQVGGLDVPEEVRREYAGRSGAWCCEVCGRSNEAILGEWRGECKEKGVVVDGDEVGEEKVEGEQGKLDDSSSNDKEKEKEGLSEQVSVSRGDEVKGSQLDAGLSAETKQLLLPLQEQQQPLSADVPASTSTSTSTSAPAPAPAPASPQPTTSPTTTTSTPTRTTQPAIIPPVSQSTNPHTPQDNPWLDRAIIGVLIALVFMILRRVAGTDD
ncbi:ubiquitin-conjugating enzyme E2 [Aspergillus affinis]|uniref:ubiquitin-conjugating enzyme E2 n=1 Tax=Aspergillus affinis TaxID=1070780 RepID=UPI0022FE1E09|nr:UBC-like protein [Aspergillus affinis]KAI9039613.1 UBC-like protein [Aspergillus affinis]